jgi:hypothetical protein
MGLDLDGDYWCRDWFECGRVAKERLSNPDAVWRKRREVARLEWLEHPPSIEEMFGLTVNTIALFRLDGPVSPSKAANGAGAAVGGTFEQLGFDL